MPPRSSFTKAEKNCSFRNVYYYIVISLHTLCLPLIHNHVCPYSNMPASSYVLKLQRIVSSTKWMPAQVHYTYAFIQINAPGEHNRGVMKWRPMGCVPVHLILSVMRKILRLFDNVVSCVSFVLMQTNELWLSKPTIIVSREGSTQQGLTSQLSLIALVCCTI